MSYIEVKSTSIFYIDFPPIFKYLQTVLVQLTYEFMVTYIGFDLFSTLYLDADYSYEFSIYFIGQPKEFPVKLKAVHLIEIKILLNDQIC